MQIPQQAAQSAQQWRPYEAAATESYLLQLPRRFYSLRWAAMYYNPLCWPLWNGCTVGEAAATGLILAQMAVTACWWAADPAFRVDVAVTGAPRLHASATALLPMQRMHRVVEPASSHCLHAPASTPQPACWRSLHEARKA